MSINFPNSPTVGQIFTSDSKSWQYTGTAWRSYTVSIPGPSGEIGSTGATGIQGEIGITGATGVVIYPAAGIAVSTGTAWDTSLAAPSGTLVGTTDAQTLTSKTFTGYTETVYALTGTTPVINSSNGTIQTWTLTGNSTPTAPLSTGQSIILMIDDGTAYSITWPSVTWKTNSGVAPTLQTTGYTAIVLWKVGTVLYGARIGDA